MTVKVKLTVSNGNDTVTKDFECKCPTPNYIKNFCPARTVSDQTANLSGDEKALSQICFKDESQNPYDVTSAFISTFLPSADLIALKRAQRDICGVCRACKETMK